MPLSHFLILSNCPVLSHSHPLADHLSVGACADGLFPRAAGLNQLQFKMKAGGWGGVRPEGDISSLLSSVPSAQPPPSLPAPFSLSLSLCLDTPPHTGTYKRRPNNPLQAKPETSPRNSSPSPDRQLVSIRCSKCYKYSLFSLISYYFSFPFLIFPSLPLDSLLGGGLN